jgi:hypothetical protein
MNNRLDRILSDISPSDLSTYYIVAAAVSVAVLGQSLIFCVRSHRNVNRQTYQTGDYIRQLTLISALYATFAFITHVTSACVFGLFGSGADTRMIGTMQLWYNAAWMDYSVRLFSDDYWTSSRGVGFNSARFVPLVIWIVPVLFTILSYLSAISLLFLSTVSLIQIVVSCLLVTIKLSMMISVTIKPSRLVKGGILLVYSFKLVSIFLSLDVTVFMVAIVQVCSILADVITNVLFSLITSIHYLDLHHDYDIVSVSNSANRI